MIPYRKPRAVSGCMRDYLAAPVVTDYCARWQVGRITCSLWRDAWWQCDGAVIAWDTSLIVLAESEVLSLAEHGTAYCNSGTTEGVAWRSYAHGRNLATERAILDGIAQRTSADLETLATISEHLLRSRLLGTPWEDRP